MDALSKIGVIHEITGRKRNRVFAYTIALATDHFWFSLAFRLSKASKEQFHVSATAAAPPEPSASMVFPCR